MRAGLVRDHQVLDGFEGGHGGGGAYGEPRGTRADAARRGHQVLAFEHLGDPIGGEPELDEPRGPVLDEDRLARHPDQPHLGNARHEHQLLLQILRVLADLPEGVPLSGDGVVEGEDVADSRRTRRACDAPGGMRPAMSETLARSWVNFWLSAGRVFAAAMVNSTVTSERPAEETDRTSLRPVNCCAAFSITSVTSSATSAALAPG